MNSDVRDLAALLSSDSAGSLKLRRGKVVTPHVGPPVTADITIAGQLVLAVPVPSHVTVSAGDAVDVLFDGIAPRVNAKFV